MAENQVPKNVNAQPQETLDFVGMDQVQASFADSFLVLTLGDMLSLFFFQNQIPAIKSGVLGTSGLTKANEAKCFARVVLSEMSFDKLLGAMASHRGFTLTKAGKE